MQIIHQQSLEHLITLEYQSAIAFFYIDIRYQIKNNTLIITEDLFSEKDYYHYLETGAINSIAQMNDAYLYDQNKSHTENLSHAIEKIVNNRRLIHGIPLVSKFGKNLTENEWELILKKFSVKTTTTFNSSFLDFLREKGLHPKPFDEEKGQWVANCPSGAKHPIMINAYFDEFGCGWCKKKGGKQELKDWIQEINLEK